MQDLNDLYIFSHVVEQNGFTGAAKALGVARSSICRRVNQLEERLGVRLVQRTTRLFAVTDMARSKGRTSGSWWIPGSARSRCATSPS